MELHLILALATVGILFVFLVKGGWTRAFNWLIGAVVFDLLEFHLLPTSIAEWLFEWNLLDDVMSANPERIKHRPFWHWAFSWIALFGAMPAVGKLIREQIKKALGMDSAGQTHD